MRFRHVSRPTASFSALVDDGDLAVGWANLRLGQLVHEQYRGRARENAGFDLDPCKPRTEFVAVGPPNDEIEETLRRGGTKNRTTTFSEEIANLPLVRTALRGRVHSFPSPTFTSPRVL